MGMGPRAEDMEFKSDTIHESNVGLSRHGHLRLPCRFWGAVRNDHHF